MGNSATKKKSKVIAEETIIKEIENEEEEKEEKKIDNIDLKISKVFKDIKIPKVSNVEYPEPSFKTSMQSNEIQNMKTTLNETRVQSLKTFKQNGVQLNHLEQNRLDKRKSSISIREFPTMSKALNSTTTSNNGSLDLQLHKNGSNEIRKHAYLSALKEELHNKSLSETFINDSIVLLRSYMDADQWVKIFDISSDQNYANRICIGIENSFNCTQKIKIISYENLDDLNLEINRIGKFHFLKIPEIGRIKDFLVRINRKNNLFYIFLSENFYTKSLEKLIKSQQKISTIETYKLMKIGINALVALKNSNIIHGSISPRNIMVTLDKSKLSFLFEMKTSNQIGKLSDRLSFGITLLCILTNQSFDALSMLSLKAIQQLIVPISDNFKRILELLLCKLDIPIELIQRIFQNWKLNGYKLFELPQAIPTNYMVSCFGNYIFLVSIEENRKMGFNIMDSIFKEILDIQFSNGVLYILYKKGSSVFVSDHEILQLKNNDDNKFQDLELNETIKLPENYIPSAFLINQDIAYFIGGKYRNLPTSKCYKYESGILEELPEISCTTGVGKGYLEKDTIVYLHFGKFSGTIEILDLNIETWTKKKTLSHTIKMLEKTFIFNIDNCLLGLTSNEAMLFKDEIVHLRIEDEKTKEILSTFEKSSFICITQKLSDCLFAIFRQKKYERCNEIILLYVNEFDVILNLILVRFIC